MPFFSVLAVLCFRCKKITSTVVLRLSNYWRLLPCFGLVSLLPHIPSCSISPSPYSPFSMFPLALYIPLALFIHLLSVFLPSPPLYLLFTPRLVFPPFLMFPPHLISLRAPRTLTTAKTYFGLLKVSLHYDTVNICRN